MERVLVDPGPTLHLALAGNVKPGAHPDALLLLRLAMRGAPARAIQELAGHQDLAASQY
jgi:hypothetical protein